MACGAGVQNYKTMGPEGGLFGAMPAPQKGERPPAGGAGGLSVHKGCGAPYEGDERDRQTSSRRTGMHLRADGTSLFFAGIFILGGANRNALGNQPGSGADGRFNLVCPVRIGLEEGLGIVTALPDAFTIIGIPGA